MSTLLQHRRRPTLAPLNIRRLPVAEVTDRYTKMCTLLSDYGLPLRARPEREAISFYLHNAAYAELCRIVPADAKLGAAQAELLDAYHDITRPMALRMFYYLLLICTRESRHLKNFYSMEKEAKHLYGDTPIQFIGKIAGSGSDGAVTTFLNTPPDALLGDYVDCLHYLFANGSWSKGYGGKAWASVANVLRAFVSGEISAELMLDTAFTLCHNNGPIFNKGMLFTEYSLHEIGRILDVQRAGMIPGLVSYDESKYVTPEHKDFLAKAQGVLESFGSSAVDWMLVKKLGAVASHKPKPKAKPKAKVGTGKPDFKHYVSVAPVDKFAVGLGKSFPKIQVRK